ncbi:MAG: transposase [Armatimonadota bacterium]|nr:transposase [Armatimonadota bacterium]
MYALRQETVERVFANIKSNKGLSRFSLRGMMGAKSEFWLACMTHNLMICVRKMAAARLYALCAARIAVCDVIFLAGWSYRLARPGKSTAVA